jgi:hypothetical protein
MILIVNFFKNVNIYFNSLIPSLNAQRAGIAHW